MTKEQIVKKLLKRRWYITDWRYGDAGVSHIDIKGVVNSVNIYIGIDIYGDDWEFCRNSRYAILGYPDIYAESKETLMDEPDFQDLVNSIVDEAKANMWAATHHSHYLVTYTVHTRR